MEGPLYRMLISSRSINKHGRHGQFLFLIGRFLAHLAKGNVSFCHHLASVVCRPLTFHILIISSETSWPNELNMVGNIYGMSSMNIAHFVPIG